MTKDQFQRETYDFMFRNEQHARDKAAEYNAEGVDGDTIVAVRFDDQWCVMLSDAYARVRELGLG